MKTDHKLQNFSKNDNGNVALLFGLSVFTIIGAIGGAVDVGRSIGTYKPVHGF